jgi:hypothetical protein
MNRTNDNLVPTAAAAEKLGITSPQLLRIAKARGVEPDKTYRNPHHRSGPPAALWAPKTLARLARTTDMKLARERTALLRTRDAYHALEYRRRAELEDARKSRRERKIMAYYGSPVAALPAACEAMFALNRYASHAKDDAIFALKTELVEHLYRAEIYTDRVTRLTRHLEGRRCFDCDGVEGDCDRCNGSGWYREPQTVASYLFEFTVAGRRFAWVLQDRAMSFEPRVEETREDDRKPGGPAEPVLLSAARRHALTTLVRFALSTAVPAVEDTDDHGDDTGPLP